MNLSKKIILCLAGFIAPTISAAQQVELVPNVGGSAVEKSAILENTEQGASGPIQLALPEVQKIDESTKQQAKPTEGEKEVLQSLWADISSPPKPSDADDVFPKWPEKIKPPSLETSTDTITGYFNQKGQLVKKPSQAMYYRKQLGLLTDGGYLVQDFYAKDHIKQTDPFVLKNNVDLSSWDPQSVDGLLTWYNKKGLVDSQAYYVLGKTQAEVMSVWVDKVGHLKQALTNGKVTGPHAWWDETGQKMFEAFVIDGTLNGPFNIYRKGALVFSGQYQAGRPDGWVSIHVPVKKGPIKIGQYEVQEGSLIEDSCKVVDVNKNQLEIAKNKQLCQESLDAVNKVTKEVMFIALNGAVKKSNSSVDPKLPTDLALAHCGKNYPFYFPCVRHGNVSTMPLLVNTMKKILGNRLQTAITYKDIEPKELAEKLASIATSLGWTVVHQEAGPEPDGLRYRAQFHLEGYDDIAISAFKKMDETILVVFKK